MSEFLAVPEIAVEPLVRAALLEDMGRGGDITTDAVIPKNDRACANFFARKDGVLAGLNVAALAFRMLDPTISFAAAKADGDTIKAGDRLASATGNARAILSAERVALNFLCKLSGIATATKALVVAANPYGTKICCTRKTTPNLRILEKYAVRAGGGYNHRFGLDDAVLIKDNHISVAGGVREAVRRVREKIGHMVKIEVEVDNIEQLEIIMDLEIDAVLLDNMDAKTLKKAVEITGGRIITEASGNISPANITETAASGVNFISSGWITHSSPALDIGLDI